MRMINVIALGVQRDTAMRTETIRKLRTTEEPLFRDHLLRLDAGGRRDRFMGRVADELLARYATKCFVSKSLVLGFFEQDNLRAAGEFYPPDGELTSDIAFNVELEFTKSRNRHGQAEVICL